MDTSDPSISFDTEGVCNHCRIAEDLLPSVQWSTADSDRMLRQVAERIRRGSAGRHYDSVIGLSGGVDSSYAAYLAHRAGLRPLAVHFDNGWNSELAVENIQRIVEACEFDLTTYVIDWREFRDLQRAFLQASVIDTELLTDHAIFAALVKLARDHGVGYLLSGTNIATEHGLPAAWVWDNKRDWTNIRAIHRQYGSVPLRTFPHLSTFRWMAMRATGQAPRVVELLNLVSYRRDEAAETLTREFGWRDYGGKHHESIFTKYFQGAILPAKFGVDKRKVHLSDQVRNGELTREEALAAIADPVYTPDELRAEGDYVRKKLGFDEDEWNAILAAEPVPHSAFASDAWLVRASGMVRRLLRPIDQLIRPSTDRSARTAQI